MNKKNQITSNFPMLSIALATFNGEKYLANLLESFFEQKPKIFGCGRLEFRETIQIGSNLFF